jgi:hypothetical protein
MKVSDAKIIKGNQPGKIDVQDNEVIEAAY